MTRLCLKSPLPIREGLGEGRVARRFSPSPSLSPEGRGLLGQSLAVGYYESENVPPYVLNPNVSRPFAAADFAAKPRK